MTNDGPLTGIRVLDLSRLLPGPFCTQLLVDLGADVIKIEDPGVGDYLRVMPPLLHDGTSALFHALNRGKRSVTLDLKAPAGRAEFLRLVATADVVVESFRPGVMEKLGLAPEALLRDHPRLVVCSITGYGQHGPLRLRAGHDVNYVARSGALSLLSSPSLLPVQVADLAGGAWPAAMQICAALVGRARTGRGACIDVSMKDGVLGLLTMTLARGAAVDDAAHERVDDVDALVGGRDLLCGGAPCYGVYPTADGFFSVGALEPKFWSTFCDVLGRPDLKDAAFDDDTRTHVAAALAQRTTAAWTAAFAAVDACCEPVLTPSQALAEGRVVAVDVDGHAARFVAPGLGFAHVAPSTTRAPRLGEHNGELLVSS